MQNRVTRDTGSRHIRRAVCGAKLARSGHTVNLIQVEPDSYLFAIHDCVLSSSLMRGAET
jgi:hypothetical protein